MRTTDGGLTPLTAPECFLCALWHKKAQWRPQLEREAGETLHLPWKCLLKKKNVILSSVRRQIASSPSWQHLSDWSSGPKHFTIFSKNCWTVENHLIRETTLFLHPVGNSVPFFVESGERGRWVRICREVSERITPTWTDSREHVEGSVALSSVLTWRRAVLLCCPLCPECLPAASGALYIQVFWG